MATIVISTVALIISIVTWLNSIKPANITLSVGDQMEIYHDNCQALYIHLPVVFQNTGAQAGVVRSLGLILRDPETKEAILIKWMGFLKPEERSGGNWIWESNATPLTISGASEVSKMAEFYGAGNVAGWLPKPIEYEFYLLAWTSESQTPSRRFVFKWRFDEETVSAVRLNLERNRSSAVTNSKWISLSGYAPNAMMLSERLFNELVRSSK